MAPCKGSSYFPLPTELRDPVKGLINIRNEDNERFKWHLARYLNPVNKKPAKITNFDNEFAKQIHFKDVKFPVLKKYYAKIEKQNSIYINVFGYKDETPYRIYTSKQTFEKHVDFITIMKFALCFS